MTQCRIDLPSNSDGLFQNIKIQSKMIVISNEMHDQLPWTTLWLVLFSQSNFVFGARKKCDRVCLMCKNQENNITLLPIYFTFKNLYIGREKENRWVGGGLVIENI